MPKVLSPAILRRRLPTRRLPTRRLRDTPTGRLDMVPCLVSGCSRLAVCEGGVCRRCDRQRRARRHFAARRAAFPPPDLTGLIADIREKLWRGE